ncbi:MAG: hemolysin III family protein [Desulfobacterales bacterium]|nr:hemolysin III family protein [Desulfobacterales bacterium]
MCNIDHFLREPINSISHAAGAIASLVGLALLIVFSSLKGSVWHIVSFTIFGFTLVMMFTSSSLYHGLRISDAKLAIFRRIDHIMIFLLIAGTYTPVCLVPLRGAWGWSIFGVVWGLALIGIILKIFFMNAPRLVSTIIYLIMGWVCVVAIYPIVTILQGACVAWLFAGGLFYSIGAVIYSLKRPNPFPGIFGFHEIWHIFVILGSFCHFWVVFKYLIVV